MCICAQSNHNVPNSFQLQYRWVHAQYGCKHLWSSASDIGVRQCSFIRDSTFCSNLALEELRKIFLKANTWRRIMHTNAHKACLTLFLPSVIQAGYPLGFNSTSVVTLRPEELMVALKGSEFRSLSFLFSLSNITNSAILHLISTTAGQVLQQTIVTALV